MSALLYFLVYLFPIIASVTFGYLTSHQRTENLFLPKLIGYYFLGTLIFWYGIIPMPIGLAVGYFFFKPKLNQTPKKWVLVIGTSISFLSELILF